MSSTTTEETTSLHIHRLEVDNFLRLQHQTVDAQGKHVLAAGPNGSGKSSLLNAIWAAIKGVSSKEFPEPIHQGANQASIRLDLGEFTIERKIGQSGMTLSVVAADGTQVPRPQTFLDSLWSKISLDPVAFLALRPQDQVDQILKIAGVAPPVDRVTAITGEQEPTRPGESAEAYLMRLSADDVGLWYVRRREAHRTLEQKRKALEEQRQVVQQLGGPPEGGLIDTSELLGQIAEQEMQASLWQDVRQQAANARAEHGQGAARLEMRRRELRAATMAVRQSADRVAELERQLAEARQRHQAAVEEETGIAAKVAAGEEIVTALDGEAQAAEKRFAAMADPNPRLLDLRSQLQVLDRRKDQLRRRQHAVEQQDRLAAEAEAALLEHERLGKIVDDLRGLRSHLLDGVALGVEDLAIGDGELRLKGVPFRQASQAEKIRVAAAVATRQNPRLKILRCDDGEHLDRHSRELLLRMAEERGWQIVMAAVADGDGLTVEIVG